MQVSLVMVMALSGLGCQNKGDDASPAPLMYQASTSTQSASNAYPGSVAPSGYPAYSPGRNGVATPLDYDCRTAVRSTLWSFILGRDPDVASVREIEATFYSGGYGASSYPGGYGRIQNP